MKIFRPVKSDLLTQAFGENKPCIKLGENGKPIRPFRIVSSDLVCPIGTTKFYPEIGLKGHNGEDWMTSYSEALYFPVDAPEAGGWYSVEASDVDGGLGIDVVSKFPFYKGKHVKFRFWHLKRGVKDEDVEFGDFIGECDNTGASSSNHLHWSMKLCNSFGVTENEDNGYAGAVTFRPFFENVYVGDVLNIKAKAKTAIDFALDVIEKVKLLLEKYKK